MKKDLIRRLITTIEECWDKDDEARLAASCVNRRVMMMLREVKPSDFCLLNETTIWSKNVKTDFLLWNGETICFETI